MSTIEQFLSAVDTPIYGRGVRYYENDMVERLIQDGCRYSAQVMGSDWEPYEVNILMEGHQVKDWHCSCPYDGGDVCKHVVAALLAIQNGEAQSKRGAPKETREEAPVSLASLLHRASREELAALILEYAGEDELFYTHVLSALGASAGQELEAAKSLVLASIRRNTHRGYIDERGCDAICGDIDAVLDTARRHMERGQFAAAMTLAREMLVIGTALASEADTSSGDLSGVMYDGLDLLVEAAQGLRSGGPGEKRAAFDKLLEAAKDRVFDGWDEWRYSLLDCAAQLADKKSAPDLSALLDKLLAAANQREYGGAYIIEANMTTRFHLIEAMEGANAARAFLSRHLDLDSLRARAVSMDVEAGDYLSAEKLCLEKTEPPSQNFYVRPSRWHELLCEIYRVSGQEDKLTAQLRVMLLLGKLACYDELKQRLQASGRWEEEYGPLLDAMAAARPGYEYMQILEKESEWELLMGQVEKNPQSVFTYGKPLSDRYPQRVHALCTSQARTAAAHAQNRREYQKVCLLLEQLAGFGGTGEAQRLVMELREAYPRRRALQEELMEVELRIKHPSKSDRQ